MSLWNKLLGSREPSGNYPATRSAIVCDRCSKDVENGDGYAFYCTSSSGTLKAGTLAEVGNMLLCEDCTSKIMSGAYWAEKIREVQSGKHNPTTGPLSEAEIRNRHDVGIIALCIHLHLTPDTAKERARKLAQLYWSEPKTGADEIARVWNKDRTK